MAEIQIRNVSKDFLDASGKPFHALKDISFTWNKGENISFSGESGSGKSTIARLLIGFGAPHEWRDFAGWREHCQMELWTMAQPSHKDTGGFPGCHWQPQPPGAR